MSERWREYVEGGIRESGGRVPFALAQWRFLFPVFLAIQRAVPAGARVLDVGCGAGVFTSFLAHHGYDVTGVDDDAAIVSAARETVDYFRSSARIEQGSAFDLAAYHGSFDLVLSLGLVEHFPPEVTVSLVSEQARCAKHVVTVVPTEYLRKHGNATDERFYSRRQMNALVRRAGCRVRESFVFGEVPSATARNAERALPGVLYRRLQRALTWAMDTCVVGERA